MLILLILAACSSSPDGAPAPERAPTGAMDTAGEDTAVDTSSDTAGAVDGGPDVDDDRDGITEDDGDCDDNNREVNPDATERCDYVDNDCDRMIDENASVNEIYYPDDDGDGCYWGVTWVVVCSGDEPPEGWLLLGFPVDCDDTDPDVCTC